jgi:hypothetical protein
LCRELGETFRLTYDKLVIEEDAESIDGNFIDGERAEDNDGAEVETLFLAVGPSMTQIPRPTEMGKEGDNENEGMTITMRRIKERKGMPL